MFKCKVCNSYDNFNLMLSKNYDGPGKFSYVRNEYNEIVITVDAVEFVPDLAFMNTYAVCKYCNAINSFEYHFLKNESDNGEIVINNNAEKKE